jgi:putative Mg2+ transporter-C (MgtC) family protein
MDIQLQLHILLDIALAAVLGFIIGFERKMRAKEAGIRTHAIVCVGSALMMCISKYGFSGVDTSRVAAQIVAGIGFLGAGIIVYRKHEVHGLTTAAGIWATAGIGMACGARLYVVALGASLILVGVQILLHMPWRILKVKKSYTLKVVLKIAKVRAKRLRKCLVLRCT